MELQKELPAGVRLVQLDRNRGWGGGFNTVLGDWVNDETADYCLISAHDSIPEAGCISRLVSAMDADSSLGIACPEYGGGEWPLYSPLRGPHYATVSRKAEGNVDFVDFPHSTLVIARRACLKASGLFDERFFAYGDEVEIALRARRSGWRIGHVWGAVVHNPGSWTPSATVAYLWARNSLLMSSMYGGRLVAFLRASVIFGRSMGAVFGVGRGAIVHPKARILAVRDFLRQSFGAPPPNLAPQEA
jgi:GT2 family glycosyltransferase